MALTDTAREAIWWCLILNELGFLVSSQPTVIHYDNKGAGDLSKNPCHHSRSKHIDVKRHFIREYIANSTISLHQVPTTPMLADILTKPLEHIKYAANLQVLFEA